METEKKKTKLKYDKWFVIVLAVMLWTLAWQLSSFVAQLPFNWANITLWAKVIASSIAIYGVVWVFRIYIGSIIKRTRQIEKLEEKLKDQPEIKNIVIEILNEGK